MAVDSEQGNVEALVRATLGDSAAEQVLAALSIAPALLVETGPYVSRAALAMALNVILFHGLLQRVPSGAAYVADRLASGGKVVFDHGALRTIRLPQGPTGALPLLQRSFRLRTSGVRPACRSSPAR